MIFTVNWVLTFGLSKLQRKWQTYAYQLENDGITTNEIRKGKTRPGYDDVNVHMIFDINMDGKFTRKSILVADRLTTYPPSYIT